MPYFFISYSHADADDFVNRFRADLQAAGIPVWIDRLGLKPGTPDWEQSLRDAITHATGLLLIATTNSRSSRYVRDELAIAEMNETPIIPVWAKGVDGRYVECVPLGFSAIQSVDARGTRYEAGLQELFPRLRELLQMPGKPAKPPKPTGLLPEPRNPYKGLVAFQENDRDDFFGREAIVDNFLSALRQNPRFLAVVGASGSGKSSAVRAGLLPRLREGAIAGKWHILDTFTPGDKPLEKLAFVLKRCLPERVTIATILEELAHKSARGLHYLGREIADEQGIERVLLTVDQFEEIFAQTRDEQERRHFIDLLTTAVNEPLGSLSIIITLRADFYQHTHNYAELVELIDHHKQSMLPMTLAELADAIQRPAALNDVQLQFEAQLVQEIVFALRAQAQSSTTALAGALPLLQFTLERLFASRDGRFLTWSAYRAMGGVQGAIGTHAEEVFSMLDGEAQAALPAVFLKLVNMDERNEPTRRRALLSTLQQTPAMKRLVEALVTGRLLVTGMDEQEHPTVEVAHEALLRNWNRLNDWLKSVAADLQLRSRVIQEAYEWHAARRPSYRLWSHERLAPVYEMQQRSGITFDHDPIIQDFIRPEWERLLEEFRYPQTKPHRRQAIIERLTLFGEEGVPTLVQLLPYAAEHVTMLAEALKPLMRLALPLMKPLLSDKNADIRRRTVQILGNIQYVGALPLLVPLTRDPQPIVRQSVMEAFGKIADKRTTGVLVAALRDKDAGVRGSAAEALGIIGVAEAARILSPLFNDPDETVRRKATIALQQMSQSQPDDDDSVSEEMLKTITSTRDMDVLVAGLYHDDARIRRRAGLALSRHKGERTFGVLLQVLQSDNASARYEAARTLGRMNETRSTPLLINALKDTDTAVRRIAAVALGQIADDRAIDPLIKVARFDEDGAVRRNAAGSVRQIRERLAAATHEFPAVVPSVLSVDPKPMTQMPLLQQEPSSPVANGGSYARVGAKTAPLPSLEQILPNTGSAGKLSPPDVVTRPKSPIPTKPADSTDPTNSNRPSRPKRGVHSGRQLDEILADAQHTDYRVRWKAADELSQLEQVDMLIRLLGDSSDVLRAFVARRLGEMRATRGVEMLIHVLNHDRDETVRRTAAISLKHINTPEARTALIQYQRRQS